ncbi:MAG: lipocalin family protein, partial [Bacteroidota bacterium]
TVSMTPLERTDIDGRAVPTHWRIEIPSRDVTIETVPLNAQSWMDTSFEYWEGPIRFAGSHEGVGYLEMTGY